MVLSLYCRWMFMFMFMIINRWCLYCRRMFMGRWRSFDIPPKHPGSLVWIIFFSFPFFVIAHFPICPPLYVQINWIFSIFSLLHVDQLNQHDICRINFSFFFPLHSVSTNWISFSTPLVDPINFLKTSFPKQFGNKKATMSLTRDMRGKSHME